MKETLNSFKNPCLLLCYGAYLINVALLKVILIKPRVKTNFFDVD